MPPTMTIDQAKALFLQNATRGDVKAQMGLASAYYEHDMYEEVEKWATMAAEQGKVINAPHEAVVAQFTLGNMYMLKESGMFDVKKGLYWLEEASKSGYEEASNLLARTEMIKMRAIYFCDEQSYLAALEEENPLQALQALPGISASRSNSNKMLEEEHEEEFLVLYQSIHQEEEAFVKMADLYKKLGYPEYAADYYIRAVGLDAAGAKEKLQQLKDEYKKLYHSGNTQAGNVLGMIAYFEDDYSTAEDYLTEAYKKGVAISSFGLGNMYFYGEGVTEDKILAKKYLREAYNLRKDMYTIQSYADCIKYVEEERPNYKLACILYKKLSKFDFGGYAERHIGDLYADEDFRDGNLMRDANLGEIYYKKSYEKGNMGACSALAELYSDEIDNFVAEYGIASAELQKRLDEYVYFTKTAFEAGEYNIGILYSALYLYGFYGRVKKDVQKAWCILKEGVDAGNLICMCGMLNNVFDGSMPFYEDVEWLKQIIDTLEDEEMDVSDYRVQYQRFCDKRQKKGGCYITTAICQQNGKPDNCYELQMFRRFRDEWLEKQPDGKNLIQEYYQTAPGIVEAIDKQPNSFAIYKNIENTYLKPCLKYIEEGRLEQCKSLYSEMVRKYQEYFK